MDRGGTEHGGVQRQRIYTSVSREYILEEVNHQLKYLEF